MNTASAQELWQHKLSFLLAEEATAVDPGQKFKLQRDIAEARAKLRELEDRPHQASAKAGQPIAPTRLRHSAAKLFGRDQERTALDKAWHDPGTHVMSIVARGGVGKTSLVATWGASLAQRAYDGARYFDWSFYSQGTREQTTASSDAFIAAALEFFGDPELARSATGPWDKGARLAGLVAAQRTLLVLDGLEPLQYPPGSPLAGELRDPALAALLRGLAQRNSGLCVVTTRAFITDLAHFRDTTALEWKLDHLPIPAGVELLKSLRVRGPDAEIEKLVRDVRGHALTLNLVGGYLGRAHGGDIRRCDQVRLEKADAKVQGGHAFKAMAAYERWLAGAGEEGARQLAVLRLLGLFDRPADIGCLAALRSVPVIEGLTEPLVGLDDDDWSLVVSSLADCGLVTAPAGPWRANWESPALDAHPLVREYFAARLREENPDGWRAAHGRLYEHLKESTEYRPHTVSGLQPLYQAVAHGCLAGRHQEVGEEVYWDRIQRGKECYSSKKLGASGANLGAVVCFFEKPRSRVSPALRDADQAWLLGEAGLYLWSLGRPAEAREPIRAGLKMFVELEHWTATARVASNLSELELNLGNIRAALKDAEKSVAYADRSGGDGLERIAVRTTLADALHQAGHPDEALAILREAEAMQAEQQRTFPLLYALQGFRYCNLLLAGAERAAWREVTAPGLPSGAAGGAPSASTHIEACDEVQRRTAQTLDWAGAYGGLVGIALDHLTLGHAALYRAVLQATGSPGDLRPVTERLDEKSAHRHVAAAVDGLRRAGTLDRLPRGLLARAWLRVLEGNLREAQEDLDEAWQLAERGPMRLFLADIHLHRARLFHAVEPYPWEGPLSDVAAARQLIERCGYWRRKEELEDAEAALAED